MADDQATNPTIGAGLRKVASIPAFASHIDGYAVPDCEALNERLIADTLAWRDADGGELSSNHQGWHSTRDIFGRPEASFRELAGHLTAALTASIRRYWPQYDPARDTTLWEGWANVNGPGAANGPHGHTYHLAGVYYVKVPQNMGPRDGRIEFLNPWAISRSTPFDFRMLHPMLHIQPRPGQIFVFPSYLTHWVTPHFVDDERISIAFNARVDEAPRGD